MTSERKIMAQFYERTNRSFDSMNLYCNRNYEVIRIAKRQIDEMLIKEGTASLDEITENNNNINSELKYICISKIREIGSELSNEITIRMYKYLFRKAEDMKRTRRDISALRDELLCRSLSLLNDPHQPHPLQNNTPTGPRSSYYEDTSESDSGDDFDIEIIYEEIDYE